MSRALAAGDRGGAAVPAQDAHEGEHMLSHIAYDWLGAQAGINVAAMTGMPQDAIADAD